MLLMTALVVGIGWNLGGDNNFFVMFFLFMPALLLYLWFGRPRTRDGLYRVLTAKLKLGQQEALRWLWQPVPTQPVYIATVPGDEARLWLKLADAIGSFPWTIWGLIYRSPLGIVIGFIVYTMYADGHAGLLGEESDAYLDGSGYMLFVILGLLVGGWTVIFVCIPGQPLRIWLGRAMVTRPSWAQAIWAPQLGVAARQPYVHFEGQTVQFWSAQRFLPRSGNHHGYDELARR